MRKIPNSRWLRIHTIAKIEFGPYSAEGLVAVVDGEEAGVVDFHCDSYYGFENCISLTEPPSPEKLFNIPEYVNLWDYVNIKEYLNHPERLNFSPEINWIWEGSTKELFYAAENNTDLMFPSRKISEEDSDYKDISQLYSEIRKYLRKKHEKAGKRKTSSFQGGFYDDVFGE